MHRVILSSKEYGQEEFEYNTFEEACQGMKRLRKSADEREKQDGIKRMVILDLLGEDEEE